MEKKKKYEVKAIGRKQSIPACRCDAPSRPPSASRQCPQPFLELWQTGDSTEDHGPGMVNEIDWEFAPAVEFRLVAVSHVQIKFY